MKPGDKEGIVIFVTRIETEWGEEAAFKLGDRDLEQRFSAGPPVELDEIEASRITQALGAILTKEQLPQGLEPEAQQVLSDLKALASSKTQAQT